MDSRPLQQIEMVERGNGGRKAFYDRPPPTHAASSFAFLDAKVRKEILQSRSTCMIGLCGAV